MFRPVAGARHGRQLTHWMGGTLSGITASLDYLQDLGVGALLLTPLFRGRKYHGYWTTDFLRLDSHFGRTQDLAALIAAAHRRDMRVIMDLPFTHCHAGAALVRQARDVAGSPYREWFRYTAEGDFQGFYGDGNLPELNLEWPAVVAFIRRVLDHWLAFGFDGVRFDHAKRPSREFWEQIGAYLREQHPAVFLLGENWHDSGVIGTLTGHLHGELNIPLSMALRRFLARPGVEEAMTTLQLARDQQALREAGHVLPTFLDNHDMERASLMAEGDADVLRLGYLLQLMLPDPPIIYYGSERAQRQSANLPAGSHERDRHFREPMHWGTGEGMLAWVRELIRIRNDHMDFFHLQPRITAFDDRQVLSFSYVGGTHALVIAINFQRHPCSIDLPAGAQVKRLAGDAQPFDRSPGRIELPARGGVILEVAHVDSAVGGTPDAARL